MTAVERAGKISLAPHANSPHTGVVEITGIEMAETYFMACGDGPMFEPVSFQIVCPAKFLMPDSDGIQGALIKVTPDIPSSAYRENNGKSCTYFIISRSNQVDRLFPMGKLPMTVGLYPYSGPVEELVRTGEILTAHIGPSAKVEIFHKADEARELYNQVWE